MASIILICCILFTDCTQQPKLDFEKADLNRPPNQFAFSPTCSEAQHEWRVKQDGENQVLICKLVKSKDVHVSLAIKDEPELLDVFLSVRIKSDEGVEDKNGGLVWRYVDAKNYLLARLDTSDKRVRLYRVVNGNRVRFGEEVNLPLTIGTWYTLRVEHRQDKIKVYLDDEAVIVEKDTHFQKAGRVGLYANENAQTSFDDFEARSMIESK